MTVSWAVFDLQSSRQLLADKDGQCFIQLVFLPIFRDVARVLVKHEMFQIVAHQYVSILAESNHRKGQITLGLIELVTA